MQMPADQTEHVHVAARLNNTYGSLMLHTTLLEKGRVLHRDAADAANITGFAAYTSGEQGISLAQHISVHARYISPAEFTSTELQTLIRNHGTADLVQLNSAFGWPDYKYLPVAQPEPHMSQPPLQLHTHTSEVCICSHSICAALSVTIS